MPHRFLHWVGLVLVLAGASSCSTTSASQDGNRWWSHIEYLASDSLEGRETGSEGHRKAAEYVADKFKAYGAEPGGTEGYLQAVPLVSRRIHESESSLSLVRGGKALPLQLGEEANIAMSYEPAPSLEAPLVFAGYGLAVPEVGYDDLEGLDLKGKVVVYVQGGPASMPGPLRAHAQSTEERWKNYRSAGAIGMAVIPNPKHMDIPWERSTLNRFEPSMTLADPELDATPGRKIGFTINPAHAERFFEGSGHTLAEVLAFADSNVAVPAFPLAYSIRAKVGFERREVESQNVVGIVAGSDPQLRDEYVVLSAHLDHLGIGGAIRGDSIYNGAMDNASGIATLIEIARIAKESRVPFKRSLVLLAVTGEEKGMRGSRYFAAHPTVEAENIVANINMDMFLPIVPFKYLTVYGLKESELGDMIGPVAKRFDVEVQDDPEPERNIFIRSDQYSFIKMGIPALFAKVGAKKGTPEDSTFKTWIHDRYHSPSDDLAQPVDKETAVRFTRMMLEFCSEVANRPDRPRWKETSFFKRYAGEAAARRALQSAPGAATPVTAKATTKTSRVSRKP